MDKRTKEKSKTRSKPKTKKVMCKPSTENTGSSGKSDDSSNVVMRAQVQTVIGDLENMVGELKAVVGGMKSLVHQIDAVTSTIDERQSPGSPTTSDASRTRRYSAPGDPNKRVELEGAQKCSVPVFHFFRKPFPPKSAKESSADLFTAQTSFIPPPLPSPRHIVTAPLQFRQKPNEYANSSLFCDKPLTAGRKLSPFQSNYPKMGVTAKLTYADDFMSTGSRECISTHERSKQSLEAEAKRTSLGISMGRAGIGGRQKRPKSRLHGYSVPSTEDVSQPLHPEIGQPHSKISTLSSNLNEISDNKSDLYETELDKQLENLKVSRCHFDTFDDSVYSYGATISSYGTMSKSLRDAYRKYRESMSHGTLESVPSTSCCAEGDHYGCAASTMSSSIAGSYPLGQIESEILFKEELLRRSNETGK